MADVKTLYLRRLLEASDTDAPDQERLWKVISRLDDLYSWPDALAQSLTTAPPHFGDALNSFATAPGTSSGLTRAAHRRQR